METKLVRIAEISATSKHPIFTSVYHLINEDTISKQSVVFRERRLMDLVITKSIFFALQSSISRRSIGLLSALVPVIPSSN